jgi:hypothetical protein
VILITATLHKEVRHMMSEENDIFCLLLSTIIMDIYPGRCVADDDGKNDLTNACNFFEIEGRSESEILPDTFDLICMGKGSLALLV